MDDLIKFEISETDKYYEITNVRSSNIYEEPVLLATKDDLGEHKIPAQDEIII